jgi:hypothetical protein
MGPQFGAFFMHTYANRIEPSVAWPKVPTACPLPLKFGSERQLPTQKGTCGA